MLKLIQDKSRWLPRYQTQAPLADLFADVAIGSAPIAADDESDWLYLSYREVYSDGTSPLRSIYVKAGPALLQALRDTMPVDSRISLCLIRTAGGGVVLQAQYIAVMGSYQLLSVDDGATGKWINDILSSSPQ